MAYVGGGQSQIDASYRRLKLNNIFPTWQLKSFICIELVKVSLFNAIVRVWLE